MSPEFTAYGTFGHVVRLRQAAICANAIRTVYERMVCPEKRYDVNIFGIVDEGAPRKGVQYNYIYGEGTKHGSVQVVSMLHHFFSSTCPAIGNYKML